MIKRMIKQVREQDHLCQAAVSGFGLH